MDERIFDLINSKIDEQVVDFSNSLCDAVAMDYAEYKALCGVIRGLTHADQLVKDLAKKLEYSDD